MTNRDRKAERTAGVNERLRSEVVDDRLDMTVIDPGLITGCFGERPISDRMRYGDCAGFGAPQARRFREQTEKRVA